jgi:subtilisin family serine protease
MVLAVHPLRRRLLSATVLGTLALGATLGGFTATTAAGASTPTGADTSPGPITDTAAGDWSNMAGAAGDPMAPGPITDTAAIGSPAAPAMFDQSPAAVTTSALARTRRYIIRFTPDTPVTEEATAHSRRGMAVRNVLTAVFPGEIVDLTDAQVSALRLNPKVATIEADTPVAVETMQSPVTWGLDRIDQRTLPLSSSYSYDRTGAGVKAYVVDSGILATHSDFGGRVLTGENSYSGIRDNRGSNDCDGHGTHVAGTIGGTTYGVAKAVTLVPVRVLDCSGGGTASGIILGLKWVIENHPAGAPAVVNLSIGMNPNSLVDDAVNATVADGITVAVAAGNANKDACLSSPSRVSAALTVGAIDDTDRRASFSNYGPCVDLFAPGVSIISDYKDGQTVSMSGTSMATPHVAGAAALLLSATPSAGPAEIATALLAQSTPQVVGEAGQGSPNRLLDTGATQAPITEPPVAPTSVSASTPVLGTTTVTWKPSTSAPVLDQSVNVYRDSALLRTIVVSTSTTTINYTSMTPGAAYVFTVQARNLIGLGAESTPSTAVVYRTAPNAPSGLNAGVTTAGFGSLTWILGADNGSALTEQIVRTWRNNTLIATTSVSGTATTFRTPTILDVSASYRFTVQARNAIGVSWESSSNSVVRTTPPAAPSEVTATLKGTSRIKLSWKPGANGGSDVFAQLITLYEDGQPRSTLLISGGAKSFTFESIRPGVTYTFTVMAQNTIGWSSESAASNPILRAR